MQAIAANRSLVRLLKRSARMRPDKFMYRLLCLLEGLQCSSQYITENKLDVVLRRAHEALINDIVNTQNWAIHEQQDAHELFGFIMERICSLDNNFLSKTSARLTSDLFNFSLPNDKRIVLCRSYCSAIESIKFRSVLCDTFPTQVFEQTLVASRVTCNSCNYHSKVVIQPEACLTVFLKNPNSTTPASSTSATSNKKLQNQQLNTTTTTTTSVMKVIDLVECLDAQSATVEPLPDMKCPNCLKKPPPPAAASSSTSSNYCQREQWITHTPKYLVLYIQRSDWLNINTTTTTPFPVNGFCQFNRNPSSTFSSSSSSSGSTARIATKRSECVHIPEYLNMAPYLMPYRAAAGGLVSKQSPASLQVINSHGDNTVDRFSSFNNRKLSQKDYLKPYILRSVIVHEGAFLQCGHYITYRKWQTPQTFYSNLQRHYWLIRVITTLYECITNYFRGISNPFHHRHQVSNSPWILTSDSHVMRVPFKQVQSSPAYLVFYERLSSSYNHHFNDIQSMMNSTDHTLSPPTPPPPQPPPLLIDTATIMDNYTEEEINSEDESDPCSSTSNCHSRHRQLSKADIIKAYASYASTFQMYDKSCDVLYFYRILVSQIPLMIFLCAWSDEM
ncbi:unnamed protein product [Trichobilharzia szidati]|nr:unnamed protein product [Trichobilharzia szidati]